MWTRIISLALVAAFAFPAAAQFDFRTTGTRSARILELRPTTGSAPSVSDAGSAKFFIPSSIGGYNTGNVYISQNGGAWTLLSSFVGSGAVSSVFGRTGAVAAVSGDYTATLVTNTPAGGIAATTVQAALNELDAEKVGAASPALTGTPTAPTAAPGTNTTQIATTAFVTAADAAGHAATAITNTPAGGIAATNVQTAINELDTEKANLASPTLTGNPLAPTALVNDNDTSIATTAFVNAEIANDAVTSARTITAGTGLTGGGDLTANRTISLANTAVTPATYATPSSMAVDAQGRITAVTDLGAALSPKLFLASPQACAGSCAPPSFRSIGTVDLTDGMITEVKIFDDAITNVKLRNSGALSVIGNAANAAGDPADISASAASDAVLREFGGVLGFGTVATGGIANDAITDTKIRNSAATSLIGRSANTSGDPADIACSATDQFFWRSGTSVVCATAASTNLSDTANIGRLNATNSWSANNTFTTFQTSGNVGLGGAASGTAGILLHAQDSANQNTYVQVTNSSTGASANARMRAINDAAVNTTMSTHGSGNTGSRFGVTIGNYGELNSTSANGLLIGTTVASPVIIGTNSAARMTFAGTTPNIGINGAPSAVVGDLLTITDTADQLSRFTVNNTSTGTAARSAVRTSSDTATISFQSNGSAATGTEFGHSTAGWGAIRATAGNGLMVGSTIAKPLILGTGSQGRTFISGTPKNLTESVATGIAEISLANNTVCGGILEYTIDADDATEYQARQGSVTFVAVSKAGTITSTAGTPTESVAVSAGTLTNTFTITNGAAKLTLNLNAVSSLTQTTLRASFAIRVNGGTCNATAL